MSERKIAEGNTAEKIGGHNSPARTVLLQRSRGFGGTAPQWGKGAGHALDQISIYAAERTSADVQRDPAPGGAAPGDLQQQVEAALQQSAQGQNALKISRTLKVQLVYKPGGPNQYRPDTNVCLINSSLPPADAAAYFVHEMYHAQRHGQDPAHDDPTKSAETDFVSQMVKEEIDGTALAIEAKLDAGAAVGGLPGESEYRSAYEFARKEALGNGSDAQAAVELGKQRGRKMVKFLIQPSDGSWPRLAPSQLESYEMYYRREWRRSNKPKAP